MSPMVDEEIEDGVTRQEYVFRSQPRDNKEHPCPRNYSHANKLYLLGILLAELYLSEAIDLRLVDGHLEPSDSQQFTSNLDFVTRMEQYPEFGRSTLSLAPLISALGMLKKSNGPTLNSQSRSRNSTVSLTGS